MDIKKIAAVVASDIFEWQLQAGAIKTTKMLKVIDGRTGYELTSDGVKYMKELTDKWEAKISAL